MGSYQTYRFVTVQAPSGQWQVHVKPGEVVDPLYRSSNAVFGQYVKVMASSQQASTLTATGLNAVLSQIETYWSTANLTTIFANVGPALSGGVAVVLNGATIEFDVLPGDASTQAADIVAVLQTTGNTT